MFNPYSPYFAQQAAQGVPFMPQGVQQPTPAIQPPQAGPASVDVVPESRADEGMAEVIGLFAQYAACKRGRASESETLKALEAVTDRLRRVVTEMYHLCGSEKEREIVRRLKEKMP